MNILLMQLKHLNSYVDLLIEQMNIIEESSNSYTNDLSTILYQNHAIYYNKLSRCNLDSKSLRLCRLLLKAFNVFNEKVIFLQLKLKNNNMHLKEFKQQYKGMNQETKKSLLVLPQINEMEFKKLGLAVILSDTNRHSELSEKHFSDMKNYLAYPLEKNHDYLLVENKEIKKRESLKESSFIKNELYRINKQIWLLNWS